MVSVQPQTRVLSLTLTSTKRPRVACPAPTNANVAYGEHERNRLDLWQAESDEPTPVVIFFHGGGFTKGDKSLISRHVPVRSWTERGITCISVNYPFLEHVAGDYFAILRECKKALDFIVEQQEAWNLDLSRIVCMGSSAGALISEWLGCHTSLLSAMAVFSQPIGTDRLIVPALSENKPPVFIYQKNDLDDNLHHPRNAVMLQNACKEKGINCELWGAGSNGIQALPQGRRVQAEVLRFFEAAWKQA